MIIVDRDLCPHDHPCPLVALCPVGAISQGDDGYPKIDYSLCIECGKCVRHCPMKAVKQQAEVDNATDSNKSNSKTEKIMKVAIPTRDNQVDDHFGHCDHYTIYTIEQRVIINTEVMPSPQGCGCKSGVAAELQHRGVEVMLAGNMGEGAKQKLEAHGISVIRGCAGPVQVVIGGYLAGALRDSGEGCASHGGEHKCGGHGHDGEHKCGGHGHGHAHKCEH